MYQQLISVSNLYFQTFTLAGPATWTAEATAESPIAADTSKQFVF